MSKMGLKFQLTRVSVTKLFSLMVLQHLMLSSTVVNICVVQIYHYSYVYVCKLTQTNYYYIHEHWQTHNSH